jgi:hypothetical protein
MGQIIHKDLGRTKHFVTAAVAMLDDFEDDMIGLAAVLPRCNGLVQMRIEGATSVLCGIDAVAVE